MAVFVQRVGPSDGEDHLVDVHLEDGHHVEVVDGDLEVLDGLDGRRVALFAAGTWLSAQVED